MKKYVEGFTFKHLFFKIYTGEKCEKFVHEYSETVEYVKHQPLFKKFTNFTGV